LNKLITFLGKADYVECRYRSPDGRDSAPGKFVQAALLELYGAEWTEQDQVIVCLTDEARQKHGSTSIGTDGTISKGIGEVLRERSPVEVRYLSIPTNTTIEEQWEIFDLLYEEIESEDTIYFDFTNGFRSFPILALLIWNYTRVMKNVKLGGIYYGAFEQLGQAHEVRAETDPNKKIAPIVELTQLASLFDWSSSIEGFLQSSDPTGLIEMIKLIELETSPILRSSEGKGQEAKHLRKLSTALQQFQMALVTCRGKEVLPAVRSLKAQLRNVREFETNRFSPLAKLLERLESELSVFSGEDLPDMLQVVRWCHEHRLIQQGFTFLNELVCSAVCRGAQLNYEDNGAREMASRAISSIYRDSQPEESAIKDSKFQSAVCYVKLHQEDMKIIRNLNNERNDINHAGMRKDGMKADKFASKLQEYIDKLSPFIQRVNDDVRKLSVSEKE
jgi:CRISPR-associated Csx2 family protein